MIVIPMAGRSKRFSDAGYAKPKFMLEAHGKSLFCHSMLSFERYFCSENFLFILLAEDNARDFVVSESAFLGIANVTLVELSAPTNGQADTVAQGLLNSNFNEDEPILIFNIDTFRWNYSFPNFLDENSCAGYLEVFMGSGSNWSNVIPDLNRKNGVLRTSEKMNESNYCSTGLYYFTKAKFFIAAFYSSLENKSSALNEVYVAPIYNHLIDLGMDIRYEVIDKSEVIFCGVPSEYEAFVRETN